MFIQTPIIHNTLLTLKHSNFNTVNSLERHLFHLLLMHLVRFAISITKCNQIASMSNIQNKVETVPMFGSLILPTRHFIRDVRSVWLLVAGTI